MLSDNFVGQNIFIKEIDICSSIYLTTRIFLIFPVLSNLMTFIYSISISKHEMIINNRELILLIFIIINILL